MVRKSEDPEVVAFLAALEHPRKATLERVRAILLALGPEVTEGIKWNAPSFRTTEWFATFQLRLPDRVRLVLHLGAKVKARAARPEIADPDGLLEWLGKDRALVTILDEADARAKAKSLTAVLRAWIRAIT